MPKYKVLIVPKPHEYNTFAGCKISAEENALERHNGGDSSAIGKIDSKELKDCDTCEEEYFLEQLHKDAVDKLICDSCVADNEHRDK